ncbi:unnamed protein product [Effrenium voratum]|uniref:Uncharacterized protein n=1 Tax=Effrenium voratum TaxID=2562239 RepID=A0AA36JBY0_9DINO|nr:unnamed protein product [Effrenium voratum]CAJ1418398.1 unnamed protein product [Effrenium voratum]
MDQRGIVEIGADLVQEVLRHRLRHPEVIRLVVREVAMPPPDTETLMQVMVPEVNQEVLERLKDHSDGKQTYFSIACSGDTGAGKSFLLRALLKHFDAEGVPFSSDSLEACKMSITGNVTCFVHKFILVFDMEGPKGTLPLMEVIPPEHTGPFKLDVSDPDHQRREKLRQEAVAKYFPPLAVAISNTMMYVTKTNPVKNHETALHIKQLAENCLKARKGT